jgi:hypothetical protein
VGGIGQRAQQSGVAFQRAFLQQQPPVEFEPQPGWAFLRASECALEPQLFFAEVVLSSAAVLLAAGTFLFASAALLLAA